MALLRVAIVFWILDFHTQKMSGDSKLRHSSFGFYALSS